MNILQGDGYTEITGDWTLAPRLQADGHNVVERECLQNPDDGNEVRLADIINADVLAFYSWCVASGWMLMDRWRPPTPKKALFVVLGVPDPRLGQGEGVWHPKDYFEHQYAFQIDEAFPWSHPLRGDVPWFDITDPQLVQKLAVEKTANINCLPLWPSGTSIVRMHTQTQNRIEVQNVIVDLVRVFSAAA